MKYNDIPTFVHSILHMHYEPYEIEALLRYIARDFFGLNATELQWNQSVLLTQQQIYLEQLCHKLSQHQPYEHLLGYTELMDTQIQVSPAALIPRPETEMLLHHIVTEHLGETALNILDICTGSGCIPLALEKHLDTSHITALEWSDKALDTARANGKRLRTKTQWIKQDVLQPWANLPQATYDIIVSNPPYVLQSQNAEMHANVLNYEPHLALFVEDQDPTLFYDHIAQKAKPYLSPNGVIYLEINPLVSQATQESFLNQGYSQVDFIQDEFRNEDRFIVAKV